MAYDFAGGVTTDRIETTFTAHATQRSYALWTYRSGIGGGGLARLFDKRDGGAEVEYLVANDASNVYFYVRAWSGTDGNWSITEPALNEWHHILVTYDGGATTNDPVIYVDGVSVTVTETSGPTLTIDTNTDKYVIGNRGDGSTANRAWDGFIAEFAIWNRILTAAEAAGIGGDGFAPIFYPASLVSYLPLVRELNDYKNAVATVTGAVVVAHPRIIYPSPAQMRRFTTAAAPGVAAQGAWRSLLGVGL